MVVEMVPVKGGIGGIVHPPIGSIYTAYIPLTVLAFWGVKNATYHPLHEPEKSIDILDNHGIVKMSGDRQGYTPGPTYHLWELPI